MWNGSGTDAYAGSSPTIQVAMTAPLSEEAIFYTQLSIVASSGTNVAFSYGSEAGTANAGSTKVVYVPPSTDVILRASPSFFIYSFASWKGTDLVNATKPSLSFVANTPIEVTATSSYNYLVLLGVAIMATVIVILLFGGSLWVRSQRKKSSSEAFTPETTPA
jgi:hypothetical protein